MLLAEYLQHVGVVPAVGDPRIGEHYKFQSIKCWTFGERYLAHMYEGRIYDFDDLNVCLDTIRSEFDANPGHIPLIEITQYSVVKTPEYGSTYRKGRRTRVGALAGDTSAETGIGLGSKNIKSTDRCLTVIPALANSDMPMPPIDYYLENILGAVTRYNLTASWDQLDGVSNL